MKLKEAKEIADKLVLDLEPCCVKVAVAGSIRREKPVVSDIDIVAAPKPYSVGFFMDGFATVIEKFPAVKGSLPCKFTRRVLPEGINLDLYMCEPENWGLIYAIRTGSARFSHEVLAERWTRFGYKSKKGYLWRDGERFDVPTEQSLFERLALAWVDPKDREVTDAQCR